MQVKSGGEKENKKKEGVMEVGRNIYCSLKLLRAENILVHTVMMLYIYRIKVRAVFWT